MTSLLIYLTIRMFGFIINFLPERFALWIGRRLGNVMYCLDVEHRRVAIENLRIAFGQEKSKEEMRSIAKKNFQNLGMMAVEFFRIPHMDLETYQKKVEAEGVDEALKVLEENKGALLLLGHFGNWELMALMSKVIKKPILVIAKPIKNNPWLERWIIQSREEIGLEIIPPKNATPKVIEALSQNKVVGILFDQRGRRSKGIWADFFGRKVPTTSGLAVMALRSGAPVLPVFMIRMGFQKHRLIVKKPLELIHTGNFKEDIEANTQLFNRVLESIIRQYPDQWLWIHRRWERKTRSRRR
ncbi:MAG: lysophospholipid acyltransferase family protein [Deltaproteobacteria bacterium]|jgi:KDO2-lipid IV(A) lauroyltransferase|nr:lysophospholipid acyltransferase family protein [Deltaproteobacteria bacterium]